MHALADVRSQAGARACVQSRASELSRAAAPKAQRDRRATAARTKCTRVASSGGCAVHAAAARVPLSAAC